jgi:bifunctional UDP-N-acetylglucosamine pyrophosphorylase/glucosamine-1-phosphate N-acetyltransferase
LAAHSGDLFALLARVGNDNAQGEYYLPDIVNIALADGDRAAVVVTADPDEVAGINSRAELADAERRWQDRRRAKAMADGATLIAPETVWFSWDTQVGRDVLIEPNVVFGPGVTVADHVTIHAFSHLEGASVGAKAQLGPYARLRPGADIRAKAKIGNFVEIKKAVVGEGAKVNHLSYVGDAEVGAGANLGAGTITCNYDGYFKYKNHWRARLHRFEQRVDRPGQDRQGRHCCCRQRRFARLVMANCDWCAANRWSSPAGRTVSRRDEEEKAEKQG